jgi:hypothetical protein
MVTNTSSQNSPPTILRHFQPLSSLWQGDAAPYPSEASARWAFRQLKAVLAQSNALAIHRGRMLVHMERFTLIVEQHAIAAAQRRVKSEIA